MISRILFFLIFLCVLSAPVISLGNEENLPGRIVQANNHYLSSRYGEAAKIYESLVAEGIRNGFLYYNLGNTYIRLNQIGPAILNFIKARKFLPRDENLEANLNYAIGETVDRIALPAPGILNSILFWMDDFNREEHLKILVTANLLFWIVLTCWVVYRNRNWDLARKTALGLLILALLSTGIKIHLDSNAIIAVVLPEKIDVQSEFGKGKVTLFQLHEGAIVFINNKNAGWVRIELAEDKKGWVPREYIGSASSTSQLS